MLDAVDAASVRRGKPHANKIGHGEGYANRYFRWMSFIDNSKAIKQLYDKLQIFR